MRNLHLCIIALLLIMYACKKGDSTDTPSEPPPSRNATVTFKQPQYGSADMLRLLLSSYRTPVATIASPYANTTFTYEITGSNGMRNATDTTIKGTGTTDMGGNATIEIWSPSDYKDGTLTATVKFNNAAATTITGTTQKEEFIIRT